MGLGCLFCKKPTRLFNIHVIYGCTECTVRDKIVDLFGPVDEHLSKDDGVCLVCVLFLNTLMCIKNFMITTIVACKANNNNSKDVSPNFATHYTDFITSLQKLKPSYCGTNVENNSEIPSDMLIPLLAPAYSYERRSEAEVKRFNDFAQKYQNYYIGSIADREVEDTLLKPTRKRSRRHKSAHRNALGSRARSTQSEPVLETKRSKSSTSEVSDCSYLGDSDTEKLRYNKGRLLNKRTRSVSRILDSIANKISDVTYKCVDGCAHEFEDLTVLTKHKIEDHKMLAKYWCYECHMTKFTSQEDLNRHNNIYHNVLISNCFLCSEELQTRQELQKHLEEHRIHSVPCNYCDKFFLNGLTCHKHIKECHKGKRKRIKKARPQTILDRIDKDDDYYENDSTDEFHEPYSEFSIKILIQSNTDRNTNSDDDCCTRFNSSSANNSPEPCNNEAHEQDDYFDKNADESAINAVVEDQAIEAKISDNYVIEIDNETPLVDDVAPTQTINEATSRYTNETGVNEDSDIDKDHFKESANVAEQNSIDSSPIMDLSDSIGYNESVETPEAIQEVLIEHDEYDMQSTNANKIIDDEHFIDQTDIIQEVVIEEVVETSNKSYPNRYAAVDACSSIEESDRKSKKSTIKNLKIVIKELKLGKEKVLNKRKHKNKYDCDRNERHAARKKSKFKAKMDKKIGLKSTDTEAQNCFKSVEGIAKKTSLDEKKLQVYEFSEECEDIDYIGKLHVGKVGKVPTHRKSVKASTKKLEQIVDALHEVSANASRKTKSANVSSSSTKKVYGNKKLRKSRRKTVENNQKICK